MNTIMLRFGRTEEGKKIRRELLASGAGDHAPYGNKQWELTTAPYATTLTTNIVKDNKIFEIYENK